MPTTRLSSAAEEDSAGRRAVPRSPWGGRGLRIADPPECRCGGSGPARSVGVCRSAGRGSPRDCLRRGRPDRARSTARHARRRRRAGHDGRGSRHTRPAPTKHPQTSRPAARSPVLLDLAGDPLARARARLERAGLRVSVRPIASKRRRNEVLNQAPWPGESVASGAVVVLTVSRGTVAAPKPASVGVPDVVGLSTSDAVVTLRDAGLRARITLVPSSASAGTVLGRSPAAGASSSRDALVRIDVAKIRPAPRVVRVGVPNLVGASVDAARSQLRALGLVPSVARVPSEQPAGTSYARRRDPERT